MARFIRCRNGIINLDLVTNAWRSSENGNVTVLYTSYRPGYSGQRSSTSSTGYSVFRGDEADALWKFLSDNAGDDLFKDIPEPREPSGD